MNIRRRPRDLALVGLVVMLLAAAWWFLRDRSGAEPGPNLLVITLDTTRADRLGAYGYADGWTPAIDGLAARGVTFDQAYSAVPLTLPSHATLFTGLYPPEHGLRVNGEWRLHEEVSTLAEALRDDGYETAAFIASFTLDSRNGLDRGFELYDDDMSAAQPSPDGEPLSVYRPGDAVADGALRWLAARGRDRPFFCWVHLFDPHTPYHRHDALDGTPLEARIDYDAEVAFADRQVARLLGLLDDRGLRGETLVVVVGDHGEGLEGDRERGHGYVLDDVTMRVPLIFSQPGRLAEGRRVGALVSLVDLYATIQELLRHGLGDSRSGRSLAAAIRGGGLASAGCYGESELPFTSFRWSPVRCLVTDRWKYVRSSRPHLFDRTGSADRRDLAVERPEVVAEMERALVAMEGAMASRAATRLDIDAEAIRRLESLGYVGGASGSFEGGRDDLGSLRDVYASLDLMEAYARAEAAGREGRATEREAVLRQLVNRSPETAIWRKDLALTLSRGGRIDEALAELRLYIEADPRDVEAGFVEGLLHARRNDVVEAVRSFGRTLVLQPDHARAHEALRVILGARSDPVGAARHDGSGSGVAPAALAEYALGVVLAGDGRIDEAIQAFERALAADPGDSLSRRHLIAAYTALARRHRSEGRLADAAEADRRTSELERGAGGLDSRR